jgi:peptide/nickel transport system permease protein
MMRFFGRRIFHSLFLLFGVSILSFVLFELVPGDFFDEMRLNSQISSETIAALRSRYGLDRPLPVKYIAWVNSVAKGELGFSFAYNSPAAPLLWIPARNTLFLTATATVFAWLIAIPLGVWSATRRARWLGLLFAGVSSTLLAIPNLVLALALLLFAVRTGYFPTGGMLSLGFSELGSWGKFWDVARHLFLPALSLVLATLPVLLSHVRTAMAEVWDAPFIRAARGHGIPVQRLLFRHALPAAANPLISLFGFSVGTLLSSSLLIEAIMSWPGLGRLMLEAILQRDLYLVIGAVMLSAVFLVTGNLLADCLLYASDPRIRVE